MNRGARETMASISYSFHRSAAETLEVYSLGSAALPCSHHPTNNFLLLLAKSTALPAFASKTSFLPVACQSPPCPFSSSSNIRSMVCFLWLNPLQRVWIRIAALSSFLLCSLACRCCLTELSSAVEDVEVEVERLMSLYLSLSNEGSRKPGIVGGLGGYVASSVAKALPLTQVG